MYEVPYIVQVVRLDWERSPDLAADTSKPVFLRMT
jgi:hypothetical protein